MIKKYKNSITFRNITIRDEIELNQTTYYFYCYLLFLPIKIKRFKSTYILNDSITLKTIDSALNDTINALNDICR